jgi:hypothetical protein
MTVVVHRRLTSSGAAAILGVTAERVRQLCRAGELEFITTPLGRLIDAHSVERLRLQRAQRAYERASRTTCRR